MFQSVGETRGMHRRDTRRRPELGTNYQVDLLDGELNRIGSCQVW